MLAKTVGVPALVGEALEGVDDVEEAWIFGSWAARCHGSPGPPPADVDVAVVGTATLRHVRAACRTAEREVGVEVNPVVLDRAQWEDPDDAFAAHVRSGPLVAVPLLDGDR